MKFRTILTFAFSIALAYAQMSDIEENAGALDQVPDFSDAANISGQGVEASGITADSGEASDDYGDAAGVDALDAGEASADDSVENSAVNPSSNPIAAENLSALANPSAEQAAETEQSNIFTGASGEAAPIAAAESAEKDQPTVALDDKTKSETSIDPAKIASGLVGAAALSSAGVFFMVKRAKRRGLESVRSQISMA